MLNYNPQNVYLIIFLIFLNLNKAEFEALGFAQNFIEEREYTEVDDMRNNRLRNPYEALSTSKTPAVPAGVRHAEVRQYNEAPDQDYDLCLDLNICNGELIIGGFKIVC